MPVFEYTAINKDGKNIKGTLDADSVRLARQKLRDQGQFPISMKEVGEASSFKSTDIKKYFQPTSVSTKELSITTRQLATLVGAGLPLVSSLNALADQTDSMALRRIVIEVREDVEEGVSFSKALTKYPRSFPRLYTNLVAAGEASGALDIVLENLANYLETQVDLRRKINSALMYPVIMLIICACVIIGLFIFVIPKIVDIFQKQGAVLPLPTQIMIFISNALVHYWYLFLLVILATIFVARWYYKQEAGRSNVDNTLLKLPIFGSIYTKIVTARLSSTLGTLLASGVGLLSSMDIVRNLVGNVHMVAALQEARDGVREGRSLANELSKSGLFPSMLFHMVAVGEKSGQLEQMLNKAGEAYEKEVNATLEGLTSLLEPLLMVVVGAIVLCIVISVLLPMADLINV
ncbi:type II secretion system inner membrane protein GspF, partial [Oligoflexia bacterium]|nr:type II secretion system inner membrane protein GspF [Oligoflexia bacterium]